MNKLNFKNLDLNLLRVFDAVMVERNLTKAARRLAMTQPAVSNAMRRLRELVGDDLVTRSGYGVQATARAQQLWPAVREGLTMFRNALAPEHFEPATAEQHFVLAMADATATELMPGIVYALNEQAPHISIRVLPLTTRDPRKLLSDRDIDLAVGHFPAVIAAIDAPHLQEVTTQFAHERLYDGRYVVVMRHTHPLAQHEQLSLDDYCAARHLLVSFSGRPFGFVDEALALIGRTRRVVLTVNQFFTAGQVVASSDLLTVLPMNFVRATGIAEALVVRELPLSVADVHVDAIWHRENDNAAAHTWLRQTVRAATA
jgi:DNA-binding transcriptional LysR family regulator